MSPIFDWWMLPHLGFFIWLASAIHVKWQPKWWVHVLLWLSIAFGWEVAEHFMQRQWPDMWVVVEHPLNAWVQDPITDGIGWLIGVFVGRWSKARVKK